MSLKGEGSKIIFYAFLIFISGPKNFHANINLQMGSKPPPLVSSLEYSQIRTSNPQKA